MEMVYSYYPGCTLKTKATHLEEFAKRSATVLGITLEENPEWQCCGAVYPMAVDEIATRLSSVRILDWAKGKEQKLVTLCSACHHVIKRTNDDMQNSSEIREKVNNYLELEQPYQGETTVLHFLEVLRDEIGFDNLKKMVKNPLTDRKIGAYYGCMLLRPGKIMQFDNVENPTIMEDFITALGAKPVIYPLRNECCGGYISVTERAQATELSDAVIKSAKENGATEIITACPLCKYNLEECTSKNNKLPVTYFTELLAEALGVKEVQS